MRKQTVFTSALILTLAGIITRLLGFFYRIYMTNIMSAEGVGLYQLIIPVYTLAWSITCSGFTTTISKLVSSYRAKKEFGNISKILQICIAITLFLSLLISFLFYFMSENIAISILKDSRLALSIKLLSFSFPFMAIGSCIRGYFFGLQDSTVPAISQVLEQCIRMLVIYLLSSWLIPMGLEYACAAAIIGVVFGEIFSFLYVYWAYTHQKTKDFATKDTKNSTYKLTNLILSMAFPLTLNRVFGSFLATFENILIPQRLQLYGYTAKQSVEEYGKIAGMAMPLIFFPTAFLIALAISMVPVVSEASAIKNYKKIDITVSNSLLFTSIIGIGSACIFIVFKDELGKIIYNQDISNMLFSLGLMCPFIYLQVTLSGILNGLGEQVFIFRNSIISSAINIGFVYFLVPKYSINAFILGWFISLLLVCCLELHKLNTSIKLKIKIYKWFLLPLLSGVCSSLIVNLISKKYLFEKFDNILALILSLILLFCLYLFFVIISDCISLKEIFSLLKLKLPYKKQIYKKQVYKN